MDPEKRIRLCPSMSTAFLSYVTAHSTTAAARTATTATAQPSRAAGHHLPMAKLPAPRRRSKRKTTAQHTGCARDSVWSSHTGLPARQHHLLPLRPQTCSPPRPLFFVAALLLGF
uniref:Uncharacterized protein n=1 Tax=Zea mays TaxID=4577 RepID=A0A804LE77_MAIZE